MLDRIIATVRRRIPDLAARSAELRGAALRSPPVRSLTAAVTAPGARVIAEIKRRSPSRGVLAPDLDPAALAAAYQTGGAAAISVLTEPEFFGGSIADLRAAAAAVNVPVLRKDFMLDPAQIWESRAIGADAVLLIVAALEDHMLARLIATAAEAGIEALVEIHDEVEAERARAAGASLVGVNARDLATFDLDLGIAERLARRLEGFEGRVAESGITGPADVTRMVAAGYDAVLVGESLVRAERPGGGRGAAGSRQKRATPPSGRRSRPPVTWVKVCGVSERAIAEVAVQAGADAIGFVLAASPRRVTIDQARRLGTGIPVAKILVTVGMTPHELVETVEQTGADGVQPYGRHAVRGGADGAEERHPGPLAGAGQRRGGPGHRPIGSDPAARRRGARRPRGFGSAFDWSSIGDQHRDFVLAGGLDPENVPMQSPKSTFRCRRIERARNGSGRERCRAGPHVRRAGQGGVGRDPGAARPSRRKWAIRRLWRAVRPGDADAGIGRVGVGVRRCMVRPPVRHRVPDMASRVCRAGPHRSTRRRRISTELGMRVLLKREDLAHTGAHKINNAIGQCLLALRMGKPRVIAETGAGQHGVATATAAAAMGLGCTVYMGEVDIERQELNVVRMRLLGAEVVPVASGAGTLKDAVSEALRAWVAAVEDTHYVIGSVVGPHPVPVDGPRVPEGDRRGVHRPTRRRDARHGGGVRRRRIECHRDLSPFLGRSVDLVGVEAAGEGIESGRHGASIGAGTPGVLHGDMDPDAPRLRWPGARGALDFGRARLPRCRPGARLPARRRVGPLRLGDGRRGAGWIAAARQHRGHHPCAGVGPRHRLARP